MHTIMQIKTLLQNAISIPPDRATVFFKTGSGQYAEGDEFIGVTVPELRKIAKNCMHFTEDDLHALLQSPINEERFLALIILVAQYKTENSVRQLEIYQFYLNHLQYINNWNLVDASAHLIIGAHLWDKEKQILCVLAESENLWQRRIAIVSTWYFIRNHELEWTFKIATLLLHDRHDLIHKAVGWMLREAGKRDQAALILFLDRHADVMPRTMLRYAIEKFSEPERKKYLMKKRSGLIYCS